MAQHGTLTLRREDGRVVAEQISVADTLVRRMRGLIARRPLVPGHGIVLRPAFSMHTAFLRHPIDVVFLDADLVVVRIVETLRPFRTASYRAAREIVELAPGECARRGLDEGDRVAWAPTTSLDAAPGGARAPLPEHRGAVLVATADGRFARLARFLLDGRGVGVAATVRPDEVSDTLYEEHIDVVLLDAGDELADALRTAGAARAQSPETVVVVVGDGAAGRAPASLYVFDKWDETDEAISAVEDALPARA